MLLGVQPKLGALFNMLLMQFFYRSLSISGYAHCLKTYTAGWEALDSTEILSDAQASEDSGCDEEELHVDYGVCDVG